MRDEGCVPQEFRRLRQSRQPSGAVESRRYRPQVWTPNCGRRTTSRRRSETRWRRRRCRRRDSTDKKRRWGSASTMSLSKTGTGPWPSTRVAPGSAARPARRRCARRLQRQHRLARLRVRDVLRPALRDLQGRRHEARSRARQVRRRGPERCQARGYRRLGARRRSTSKPRPTGTACGVPRDRRLDWHAGPSRLGLEPTRCRPDSGRGTVFP